MFSLEYFLPLLSSDSNSACEKIQFKVLSQRSLLKGWIVQVVLRLEQIQAFVLLKKRWVVERTFGWLMGSRRWVRDYE